MTAPSDPWLVSLSYRLYSILLLAYPPAFRRAYREEMARVFRDSCRGAYKERGTSGVLYLWIHTLKDLTRNLVQEWTVQITGGALHALTEGRRVLPWFAVGAGCSFGLMYRSSSGLLLTAATVLLGIAVAIRLGPRGAWAALIGFGFVPVVIFGHAIASAPLPCPRDPSWPDKPCVDPLMGQRIGILVFGFITVSGLCLAGGRRLELGSGLFAGLACLASGVYAAFWPLSSSSTCTSSVNSSVSHCVTTSVSFWQQGAYSTAALAVFLGLISGSILAGSAYLHGRHEDAIGLTILWIAALLLTVTTIVGMFSIGIFSLLPAAFTWIATWAGTGTALGAWSRDRKLMPGSPNGSLR